MVLSYRFRPGAGPVALTLGARAESVPDDTAAAATFGADRFDLLDPVPAERAVAMVPRLDLRFGGTTLLVQPSRAFRMDRSAAALLPDGIELAATSTLPAAVLSWRMSWQDAARLMVSAAVERRIAAATLKATLSGARGVPGTGARKLGLILEAQGPLRRDLHSTVRLGLGVEAEGGDERRQGPRRAAAHVDARLQLRPLWPWRGAIGYVAMNGRQDLARRARAPAAIDLRAGFGLSY